MPRQAAGGGATGGVLGGVETLYPFVDGVAPFVSILTCDALMKPVDVVQVGFGGLCVKPSINHPFALLSSVPPPPVASVRAATHT